MKRIFIATLATLAASAAPAAVLDFEGFAGGTIIDDEYSALGVTISVTNVGGGPDLGVIYDTTNMDGSDPDLNGTFAPGPSNSLGSINAGNVLIIQENFDCDGLTCTDPDDEGSRPGGTITIDFGAAVTLESLDFFDIEDVEATDTDASRIVLFDINGAIIDVDLFTPTTGGDNQWERLLVGVNGVASMQINMGGSGAIDNVRFAPVPLPGALLMLASALAGLGASRAARVRSIG